MDLVEGVERGSAVDSSHTSRRHTECLYGIHPLIIYIYKESLRNIYIKQEKYLDKPGALCLLYESITYKNSNEQSLTQLHSSHAIDL